MISELGDSVASAALSMNAQFVDEQHVHTSVIVSGST